MNSNGWHRSKAKYRTAERTPHVGQAEHPQEVGTDHSGDSS